jgi:hypothetical protein
MGLESRRQRHRPDRSLNAAFGTKRKNMPMKKAEGVSRFEQKVSA